MMSLVALALLSTSLAAMFATLGVWLHGPWRWLAAWAASSCAVAAAAWWRTSTWTYGKRADGGRHLVSTAVLLPFLLPVWCYWHLRRPLLREAPWHALTPTLRIGRRLLDAEFGDDVDHIVDLTCEYAEPLRQRRHPGYVCMPMLDGTAPLPEVFARYVQHLLTMRGTIYLHCAEGHGRTATVAAAWLLATGQAADPAAALLRVAACRPRARPYRRQIAALERFWAHWPRA